MVTRLVTEDEHAEIMRALPLRLRPMWREIEYVKICCHTCQHQLDGVCERWGEKIPQEHMRSRQECWEQCIIPF